MTLIKSISGIRGTIGGAPGLGLTPLDVVRFTSAFAAVIKEQLNKERLTMVIGRDARISGDMVNHLAVGALMSMGVDVIDLGLSTTPTVELAVVKHQADAGIILTASHNPKQWNALKLLNHLGEFISAQEGLTVLEKAHADDFSYVSVDNLGKYTLCNTAIDDHIEAVLNLPLVDVEAIKKAELTVAIDAVNSTGGIAIPLLLEKLGVKTIIPLFCEPTGNFPHNPEPLPEHLSEISATVVKSKAHVGFVVDPDVDRLALVCENGDMFGEEYTLVAVADYVLANTPGNTVSNMSSTRALRDVTEKAGGEYNASAVGEVNVVEMMKASHAVIGGEGNGGVIYPELHFGRDALVGIALFLTHMVKSGKPCSGLRDEYPSYFISKNKIQLSDDMDVDMILETIRDKYQKQPVNTIDGVKIEFEKEWVHLRKSNTEPIIRIYSESDSPAKADVLARKLIDDIRDVIRARV